MVSYFFGGEWQCWAFTVEQRQAHSLAYSLLLERVCQETDIKKNPKWSLKTMNLCQKTRNSTYRATFMTQSRGRVSESPKRSALGIAHTKRWQSPLQGSTTVMLSPIRNVEGTFLTGTTSDAGDKMFTREKTLSKLAHSSSLSSKSSGQDDIQDHPLM